jgi:hypothetical protein
VMRRARVWLLMHPSSPHSLGGGEFVAQATVAAQSNVARRHVKCHVHGAPAKSGLKFTMLQLLCGGCASVFWSLSCSLLRAGFNSKVCAGSMCCPLCNDPHL